jgi:hypothetical protein
LVPEALCQRTPVKPGPKEADGWIFSASNLHKRRSQVVRSTSPGQIDGELHGRWALVEAAQHNVGGAGPLRQDFRRIAKRRGRQIARGCGRAHDPPALLLRPAPRRSVAWRAAAGRPRRHSRRPHHEARGRLGCAAAPNAIRKARASSFCFMTSPPSGRAAAPLTQLPRLGRARPVQGQRMDDLSASATRRGAGQPPPGHTTSALDGPFLHG